MKTMRVMMLVAALMLAARVGDAETRSTGTSERAYVLTHSEALDGVCYDAARKELTLFFHSGTAYVYQEVPEQIFRDLVRSESAGHFYHTRIRGQFASRRMTEGELVAMVERHDVRTGW